jgi:hypothetical protein
MKDRLARFFNNKPIVWKFIVLVACIDALGCFITGDIYYRYASRTILQNSSDSLSRETAIVGDYLQEKGSMLLTSLFSLVTNNTLQNSVSQYCSAPTGENTTRLVAELNDDLKQTTFINGGFLRGVVMFINNQMFYDFSLARKKPVDFSSTDLYQTFQHQSKGYYLGFPAMEDPFFIKNGNVIPIVFRYEMHEQEVYVVALVEQSYLTSYLESYRDLTFFIANGDGSPVIPWGSVFDGVVGKRGEWEWRRFHRETQWGTISCLQYDHPGVGLACGGLSKHPGDGGETTGVDAVRHCDSWVDQRRGARRRHRDEPDHHPTIESTGGVDGKAYRGAVLLQFRVSVFQ